MKKLFLILIPFLIEAQTLPIKKDVSVYQGDYSIIQFQFTRDISADSIFFGVVADREDSSGQVIQKWNNVGGGSTSQIEIAGNIILVKLLTTDTEGLEAAVYDYDLTQDSVTIFTGKLKITDQATGQADGVATRTPYYTIALDTPNVANTFIVGQDSNNIWYRRTANSVRTILGIDTLTGATLIPDSVVYPYELDTIYTITDNLALDRDTLKDNASYRWYVDSEDGSDANNGKTPLTAFQNLTKIQTLYDAGTLPEYSTIYLKAGSEWGQSLVLGDNYTIKSYGEGERPIISGADTVANASFTLHSSDIYKITDWAVGSISMVINAYEDGEVLTRVTTLTAMPAGSFAVYNQNTDDFQDGSFNEVTSDTTHRYTIYIRAKDSSDVTANSNIYEVVKRLYVIFLGDDCVTEGIHTTKQGFRDGSLVMGFNAVIDNCKMSWGQKHNSLFFSGILKNSILWYNEIPLNSGGASQFVASTPYPDSHSVQIYNNKFYMQSDDGYTYGGTNHSSGNSYQYQKIICDNNYFEYGEAPFSFNEIKQIYITNNMVVNSDAGFTSSNATVTDTVYCAGNTIIKNGVTSLLITKANSLIENNLICFNQAGDAAIVKIDNDDKIVKIENNIFYKTVAAGAAAGVVIWNNGDDNSLEIKRNIFYNWGWLKYDSLTTTDITADSNIYYPFSQITLGNGETFATLQEVKDSTTWDDNSLDTDPKFVGSPLDSNWFYSADDAIAIKAGNVPVDYTFTAKDGEIFTAKEKYDSLVVSLNEKIDAEDVDLISKTEFYPFLTFATSDTVALNYYDDATIWDEWKYSTDDTLTAMAQYKQDDDVSWTNMFSSALVMNGTSNLQSFAVDTIPAESQARMYFTAVGDNFNDGWIKIYRRLTESVETVWTDTLYYFNFKYNINDIESQQVTSIWNAGIGNKFGICRVEANTTENAFIFFYTDSTILISTKEVRLKYDFYVPASNTGFETGIILLGKPTQPNMTLNYNEGSAGRWVSVDTTLTLTSNIKQFRIYLAENGQYKNYNTGDTWYFDNIMILGKP